jgi:hypothetical protein
LSPPARRCAAAETIAWCGTTEPRAFNQTEDLHGNVAGALDGYAGRREITPQHRATPQVRNLHHDFAEALAR